MNERIQQILNHKLTIPVSVGVVAFGAGVGLGYFLGRRPRFKPYVVPPIGRITKVEEDEEGVVVEGVVDTSTIRNAGITMDGITDYRMPASDRNVTRIIEQVDPGEAAAEPEEAHRQNVFAAHGDTWNYDAEIRNRDPDVPYVIHQDEFFGENEDGFDFRQVNYTYYVGDDILVDEREDPVHKPEEKVGPLLFGHGSGGDPNIFYVRNVKLQMEYEIVRDEGYYSVEVLGLSIEDAEETMDLKHSDTPRRFRRE